MYDLYQENVLHILLMHFFYLYLIWANKIHLYLITFFVHRFYRFETLIFTKRILLFGSRRVKRVLVLPIFLLHVIIKIIKPLLKITKLFHNWWSTNNLLQNSGYLLSFFSSCQSSWSSFKHVLISVNWSLKSFVYLLINRLNVIHSYTQLFNCLFEVSNPSLVFLYHFS